MSSEKVQKDLEIAAGPREWAGWVFGDFRVEAAGRLFRNEQPMPLTPKAFQALIFLLRRRGRLVTRDELIRVLWPDSFVDEANLTSTIWTIRRALGDGQAWIQTVPKRGYLFVGEVRELAQQSDDTDPLRARRALAVLPLRPLLETQRDEALEVGPADTLITRLGALRDLVVRPISAVHRFTGQTKILSVPGAY